MVLEEIEQSKANFKVVMNSGGIKDVSFGGIFGGDEYGNRNGIGL